MSTTHKKIQNLATRIVSVNEQIRDIDNGVEAILRSHYGADRWQQIKTTRAKALKEREALEKQLKEEARSEAVTGENVVVVENESIKVSVSGTKPKVVYDPEFALENWPEELVDDVMVYDIDTERLAAKIQLGLPADTLELVNKARSEEPQTPKVTIKLLEPDVVPASDVAPVVPIRRTGT